AAPDSQLILVRVEPTALHQLETVARSVAGDPGYSEALQSRSGELVARGESLATRRTAVTEEYRLAFADLSDEEGPTKRRAAAKRQPVAVWVQAASPAVGQVWAGAFFDADANGVMEFAPAGSRLPAGGWTRELNFLGFAGPDDKAAAALPAGLKIRATVQWR